MQQLHLVGLTTDLDGLIFSARRGSKSGGFVVELDDRLVATIAETVLRRDGATSEQASTARALARASGVDSHAPRPPSTLSPREIQARLRAGRSIEDVADEAGVEAEWVERFAAPIIAEQAQVVERAGQLFYARPRVGPSSQPMATAVRWNLADRGIRFTPAAFDAGWTAFHVVEGMWVVRFEYVSRGRGQAAEWEVDLHEGDLVAANRLAAQLSFVEKGRRRRLRPRPVIEEEVAETPAARRPRAKKAAKKKAAPRKATRRPGPSSTRNASMDSRCATTTDGLR